MSTPTLQLLIGAAGLAVLFGPAALGAGKKLLFSKPEPADTTPSKQGEIVAHPGSIVHHFYNLVVVRKLVAEDPKAVEAIDTVLIPAIIKAEANQDES